MQTGQASVNALKAAVLAAAVAALGLPSAVGAQEATAVAGTEYEAGSVVRFLAGSNWRELWAQPVRAPLLDLDTFAGGIKFLREGGRTSRTLHFEGADGREYIFRSANKFLHKEALPDAVKRTPAGDVVQDQNSTMLPVSGLIVGPLYEAMDLLSPWPTLVIMPDDPRLGEHRDFAGMLGQIEEDPNEGEDNTPGFAGSTLVVGNDRMLERLDESSEDRLDAAEYLAARLIQFLVGDPDRGGDQWRYAAFPAEHGRTFRPVARDHDWAFMITGGVLGAVLRAGYPKLTHFDDTFDDLATLTFMTRDMDRRFLVELPRERWDSVVTEMQSRLTDEVFEAAINRMPPEYLTRAAPRIRPGLRARRAQLPEIAAEFFAMVSHEADVHATDESDYAEVARLADGSVEVRLSVPGSAPYFQRRFIPAETREIRLYLMGGDDEVIVRGTASFSIPVRVIGGAGDDVMVDSSRVADGGRHTVFYTARGDDEAVTGPGTRVDDTPYPELLPGRPLDEQALAYVPDAMMEGVTHEEGGLQEDVSARLVTNAFRDWGRTSGFSPAIDYREGPGLMLGASTSVTRYGFRRQPHRYQLEATALYSVDTNGFGIELMGDYHPENTKLGLSLEANATQFETFRFHGYGNDTEVIVDASPRVYRDQVTVRPSVYWQWPGTYFGVGPIFRYGRANYDDGSAMDVVRPLGSDPFGQLGAAAALRFDLGSPLQSRRAFSLMADGSAYPSLLDVSEPFGRSRAIARAWIPLGWPFVALRVGGEKTWGAVPVHEAAFLGGRTTLRGYETDRFAGDASLYGSTELHAPLGTLTLLVRGELGVFGLADAGRVFVDDTSAGDWHTSYGGGVWFSSLSRMLSLAYARGEIGRLYLRLGMPL
ncbi:MAG: hypothetical protein KFH98_03865 [Gemmatimonadetes bacterium]|nr:hypothetical protein [Gemmatimonadota bacterium]